MCDSYILAIQLNVKHSTVVYRTVVTGEAEKVMNEENRGVTLIRYSDMKDACIERCYCGFSLCK